MTKSLTDSPGWITSAFKGQTPATDLASFCRGKLGSHFQRGAPVWSETRVGVRYCLHDSHQLRCSFLTASLSGARCVTAAPLRIRASDRRVSAVRKMQPPRTFSLIRRVRVHTPRMSVAVTHLSGWLTGGGCRSGGAVPGPWCWKLSQSATWPRQDRKASEKLNARPC